MTGRAELRVSGCRGRCEGPDREQGASKVERGRTTTLTLIIFAYTHHILLHKIIRILIEVNAESFDETFPSGINVILED